MLVAAASGDFLDRVQHARTLQKTLEKVMQRVPDIGHLTLGRCGRLRTLFVALLLFAACSSSGTDENTGTVAISGSREGVSLDGLDHAFAAVVTDSKGASLEIVLTEGADCAAFTVGDTAGATYFELFLYGIDASGNSTAPTAPATFAADVSSAGPYVEPDVEQLGSDCSQTSGSKFGSGVVTLTSLSGAIAAGSIDLTAGSDHTSGTFTTVLCQGVATHDANSQSGACHGATGP